MEMTYTEALEESKRVLALAGVKQVPVIEESSIETVADLIAALAQFPASAKVYTVEGDCDDEISPVPQLMNDGRVRL